MSFAVISRRILTLVVSGFAGAIILIWANDLLAPVYYSRQSDLGLAPATSAHLLAMELREGMWLEFSVEVILIAALAVVVLLGIRSLLARIRYLEGFLLVCASCKSVRADNGWVPLERYLEHRADLKISHSLCPSCLEAQRHTHTANTPR